VKALIEISLATNVEMADVSQQIQRWDGVERVLEVTGEHDIVVVVDVANTGELNDIIERIRQFKEVQSTRSRLILRQY
jgi:DNA-binding Lrp family transcriptional regulator